MEGLVWLVAALGAIAVFSVLWLWRERREFENLLNQLRKENKDRSQQLEQARQEILTLRQFQNQQSSQIQAFHSQLETFQQEKADIETQLKSELQTLQESQQKLEAKITQLEATPHELSQHIQLLQSRLETVIGEKKEIHNQLNQGIQKLIDVEKLNQSKFEKQILEIENEIQSMRETKQQLIEEVFQLNIEVTELKHKLERQKEIHQQTISELGQRLNDKIQALENEKVGLEIRLTLQTQQLEKLEQENQEIKNQLDQIIQESKECQKTIEYCPNIQRQEEGKLIFVGKNNKICQYNSPEKINPTPPEDLRPFPPYGEILKTLAKYLGEQEWKKADQETVKVLLKAAYQTDVDDLDKEAFASIPRELLREIDRLWITASEQRFGFSFQQELWWQVTGDGEGKDKTRKAFCEQIGWRNNGDWLNLDELTYDLSAPMGHLPALGLHLGGLSWGVKNFSWGRRSAFEYFLSWVAIYADEG